MFSHAMNTEVFIRWKLLGFKTRAEALGVLTLHDRNDLSQNQCLSMSPLVFELAEVVQGRILKDSANLGLSELVDNADKILLF